MKNLNYHLSYALLAIIIVFTLSTAWSPAIRGCHNINAKGEGSVTGQTGNITFTEADIIGGGLLHGTTSAEFTFHSADAFTGTLLFTTRHGSLEFYISDGYFGGTSFRATAVAVEGSGTGKLAGASGTVVIESVEVNPDGSFTEELTGEICFE